MQKADDQTLARVAAKQIERQAGKGRGACYMIGHQPHLPDGKAHTDRERVADKVGASNVLPERRDEQWD